MRHNAGNVPVGASPRGTICFIGIGSNRESPAERCREAVNRIAASGGIAVLGSSSLYRTEPVGMEQDWFINAVIEIRTTLAPRDLLKSLLRIEDDMGRVRGPKWGPRIIDLDILLYGQDIIEEPDMVIPHPELHKRRFVLVPLNEIASYVIHPAFGVSVAGLMDRLEDRSAVERYRE